MARSHRDVPLPVNPNDAYMLARASGYEIPSFRLKVEDPARYRLRFHRGFGWSNPIDVDATVWETAPGQSVIRYEASILALADPFRFLPKNLDRFEAHVRAHHQAWLHNQPPPPPPTDSHSIKVNALVAGVAIFGVFVIAAIVGLLAASR